VVALPELLSGTPHGPEKEQKSALVCIGTSHLSASIRTTCDLTCYQYEFIDQLFLVRLCLVHLKNALCKKDSPSHQICDTCMEY
jgi:hypothetical protein